MATAPVRARTNRMRHADAFAVFALAALVRLLLVVTSRGGFTGDVGYDQSVYFTAADALTHGRMPYADFVLLHPPGIVLALTPFAALARLTGDHAAFVTANVVFALLGAANAALITRIAARWRLGRRAALVGGVFYAVWSSAAGAEISARLEPLATFAFLCGVLVLGRRDRPTVRVAVLAGAALGFAATVKIWWVVALLVLVGWHGPVRRDARTAGLIAGGAGLALAVVVGPFFVHAPASTWRMIVADQVGRPRVRSSPVGRLLNISSLSRPGMPHGAAVLLVLALVAVAAFVAVGAWRQPRARPILVVAAAQLLVLLLSPSFYPYYAGFQAAAVALVLAAATGRTRSSRHEQRQALVATLVVGVAGSVTATFIATGRGIETPAPLPVGRLPGELRTVRCVVADSPMALIAVDALSRGLASGCPNWVDVSGRTYDVDASTVRPGSRVANERWQIDVRAYLMSGQAMIVIRGATGLSPSTRVALQSLPVLARHGNLVVRAAR